MIAEANTGESGGLSGPMRQQRALEVLGLIRAGLDTDKTVISVGGVFTRSDLQQRIDLGVDLVQGYTGFVYGGPAWAKSLTG